MLHILSNVKLTSNTKQHPDFAEQSDNKHANLSQKVKCATSNVTSEPAHIQQYISVSFDLSAIDTKVYKTFNCIEGHMN